jgi:aerobic carbon-monoxide dehydrogenase medium subunit
VKPRPFEYRRAANLAEVYAQLSEHGDSAKIVAGGQSLVPMMNLRLVSPSILLDIGGIDELRSVTLNGDMLRIGALVRHCEVASSPLISRHAPLLAKAVEHVAHLAIRNRGTFGGSCCHADPAAEFPACSLLLGAVMEIASVRGTREVAAADFFHGPFTTAVQPDELLLAIHIPAALPDALFAFHELSRRQGDFALSGIAARARCVSDAWVTDWVAFGVSDRPVSLSTVKGLFDDHGLLKPGSEDVERAVTNDLADDGSDTDNVRFRRVLTTELVERCRSDFSGFFSGETI